MSETMAPPSAGSSLDELRTQIRGPVAGPHDPDPSRPAYNAMHASTPDVIVRASGTADVVDAVNHARASDLQIAIRGGGHSIAGLSSPTTGMLIDLADMRGVHVDPHTRRATVQGGAVWADVDRETQAHGLVAPGGVVSDTGVAGLTLGGGYGWVRRKYGLTVDQLVEAQLVTADGQVLTANETEHPDLFWAIRGGGGNFGVVTSFTFALHPLGPLVGFSATFYPAEEYASVVRGWRDYASQAPDEVSSLVVTLTSPRTRTCPRSCTTAR
jgi:FAD/FMN-containing dehydrogenase